LGLKEWGFEVPGLGVKDQSPGFWFKGSGFRVMGSSGLWALEG